jgi:putative two-component system response regulator
MRVEKHVMCEADFQMVPAARVLVAEGSPMGEQPIAETLQAAGHQVVASQGGEEVLVAIRRHDPEIVLLDVHIPRPNAFQITERLKSHPTTCNIPVVLLIPSRDRQANAIRLRGLAVGADDFLLRPIHEIDLHTRVRSLVTAKRLSDQAETTEGVIFGLARMLDRKMSSSLCDIERLGEFAAMLGRAAGLPPSELDILARAAVLHDIGKVAVREELLRKPGALSAAEFEEVKLHAEVGARLCESLREADDLLPVVRHLRERWDGSGYPDGLRGVQIPVLARILAIADAYDALISERPHRPAFSDARAREVLLEGSGIQWDPQLVAMFLRCLSAHTEKAA